MNYVHYSTVYLKYYYELFVNVHETQRNSIFSRDLSFVILGVVTMYRATNAADYLQRLARLCDVLLEFEVRSHNISGEPASGFLMRMTSPRVAYVDCHSAALLALTQAARYLDDPRLVAAIERGLASYSVETCTVAAGDPYEIDTVSTSMVDRLGTRRTENAFWNFKAGMTLRFFAALRRSSHPSLRSIAARYRERMELFEIVLRTPAREIDHSGRRGHRNPHRRFCRRDQLGNTTLGNARVIRSSVGLTHSLGNPCGLSAIL